MNITEAKKRRKKKPFGSISYTTGDISLNIDRFNTAMGSLEGSEAGVGGLGALAENAHLQEAKRNITNLQLWEELEREIQDLEKISLFGQMQKTSLRLFSTHMHLLTNTFHQMLQEEKNTSVTLSIEWDLKNIKNGH